jgi:S-adenosylmethionine hydrolase
MAIIGHRADNPVWRRITWRPGNLSSSFHGRDLFAPVAAQLVAGLEVESVLVSKQSLIGHDWPDQLPEIVYIDCFGNLITGISAETVSSDMQLQLGQHTVAYARTFSEVPVGTMFWYANSFGLVEIAVNQGRADRLSGAGLGDNLSFVGDPS